MIVGVEMEDRKVPESGEMQALLCPPSYETTERKISPGKRDPRGMGASEPTCGEPTSDAAPQRVPPGETDQDDS